MRALQLFGGGELRVGDKPVPDIGPDEVLVRVAGAGLCHSDLHIRHFPDWPLPGMVLGHETAGRVASIGSSVTGFAEGDPVLVYLVWACGTCRACREGRDNVCATTAGRLGTPPCPGIGPDGGMAEYIKAPARFLEPLGSLDPATAGPLADAGLTSMHAINGARSRLTSDATAVVIGIGGLGHVGLQLLKATTDVRVVAVDSDPEKLELARRRGAHETVLSGAAVDTILQLTDGIGADAVFDFVGVQATVDLATSTIGPDGALRFVGLGGGAFSFDAGTTFSFPWGADVRRSYGGTRADQRQVLDLAAEGKVVVDVQHYDLEDGPEAFDDLEAGRVTGRAVLVPNGS